MDLSTLDISTLSEREQAQLYPFYHAYTRPYPPALSWRQLRADGFTPVDRTKCGIAEIEESFDEICGYRIDEEGLVVPISPDDERATWMDRKINAWSRKKEWSAR